MISNTQNQKTARRKELLRKAGNYLLGYVLYAGVMAALFFLLWRIFTDVTLVSSLMGYNVFQVEGITNYTVVILGLIMLVGVGYSEDRLRKAIPENRMWKVLLRIYLVTAAAWALWMGAYYVVVWFIL
jgi:hypothetical protein